MSDSACSRQLRITSGSAVIYGQRERSIHFAERPARPGDSCNDMTITFSAASAFHKGWGTRQLMITNSACLELTNDLFGAILASTFRSVYSAI
jgi:hypothetical protein